jgi:hypothetical protein
LLPEIEAVRRCVEQPVGRLKDAEVATVENQFVGLGHVDPLGVERPHTQHPCVVELGLEVVVEPLHRVEGVDLLLIRHRADRTSVA